MLVVGSIRAGAGGWLNDGWPKAIKCCWLAEGWFAFFGPLGSGAVGWLKGGWFKAIKCCWLAEWWFAQGAPVLVVGFG